MNLPPRIVVVLSFLQAFFILAGFFITRSFLKIFDEIVPELGLGSLTPPIPALLQFIRSYGLWCLLVPLVWSLAAASSAETSGGVPSIIPRHVTLGILLTVILVIVFTVGALRAMQLSLYPV